MKGGILGENVGFAYYAVIKMNESSRCWEAKQLHWTRF